MAFEESLSSVSMTADASLAVYTGPPSLPGSPSPHSGKQYRLVKVIGASIVGLAVAADDPIVGVMQNKPQYTGNAVTVGIHGISQVMAGGVVAAADLVSSDDEGRAVKVTEGSYYGIALTAASAEGQLISVLIAPGYVAPAVVEGGN